MIWQNWSVFIAMGGYALYVWGAVLVFFAALTLELFSVNQAKKSLLRELKLEQQSRDPEAGRAA
ncbi:heme exporter protein CcmD [Undibacterium sp. Ji83W]|uniref:heme exporter protein CcmD n=1 Tax=Undibacterium sp. Ji83W TaxID=3413043 RepID=UPI003BF2B922